MGTKHYNLPKRYEGRKDVPYVLRGWNPDGMEKLATEITERLAQGESLRAICKSQGMPRINAVLAWAAADPGFARRYALAREAQAETFAQELIDLADAAQGLDAAGVNAARLRVDTRKWIAARILPKQYGDNVNVEHSGALSVATVSKLLRVEPVTFDDVEDAELVDDKPTAKSVELLASERALDEGKASEQALDEGKASAQALGAIGTKLAGVSTNGGVGEGVHPGKGTPITVTTPVSPVPQISEIPSKIPQSSVDIPTALSDLL